MGSQLTSRFVAIDQALLVEIDEDLAHGGRGAVVHGEAGARPVGGRAQAAQLLEDRPAGLFLPGPDPLQELLPAQVAPVEALLVQLALDHHLGRDAGVVHARLPERVAAGHPVVADQDVLDREGQGVTDVQAARDVGRRHGDGIGLGLGRGIGGEGAGLLPLFVASAFDLLRPIGFVQHRWAIL